MHLTTKLKAWTNAGLRRLNIQVDTLTAANAEQQRLLTLARSGHFNRPVFPVPPCFTRMETAPIFTALQRYAPRFADFEDPSSNDVGYSYENDYFVSPDAEVLYSILRHYAPATIVEVGSGHSTKISRQAILDGRLATRLICIDPQPRISVREVADEVFAQRVENLVDHDVFGQLKAGDVLFIDSSHAISAGNDVVMLCLRIIPALPRGVLIHLHDVFLPYDYPEELVVKNCWSWNEQYLIQALLAFGDAFDVLWAGHYLQRVNREAFRVLSRATTNDATSLWLRKRA